MFTTNGVEAHTRGMAALLVLSWIAFFVLVGCVPALAVKLLTSRDQIAGWSDRVLSRHFNHQRFSRLLHRGDPVPQPLGPPVEKLAVELRRLSCVLADDRPVSSVRWFGVERAYDETLERACRALEVPCRLNDVGPSEREFERLRVEAMLEDAGLVLRGPGSIS